MDPAAPASSSADPGFGPGLHLSRADLRWRFSRAAGPGGQNVNRRDSRVELVFDLAGSGTLPPLLRQRALRRLAGRLVEGCVVVVAEEHRSQWRNRQAAQERLLALLEEAIAPPPPPRRATRPSRGAVERRLQAKRRRGERKGLRGGRLMAPED